MAQKPTAAKPAPRTVPVAEAADTLGQLLNDVQFKGEEVVISRHGKPAARLVPVEPVPA